MDRPLSIFAFVATALSLSSFAAAEDKLSYNIHIRPILSDKCFLCHGPDEANNSAGLRLDTAEHAYAALVEGNGHGIVPGDLDASEAYQRIISDDPNKIMPTPESNLVLTQREKDLIKQWIEEGAEYEPHWSFVNLPKEVPLPDSGADWAKVDFDKFIHARLEVEGLEPSEEADPLRWLRRATFDLTGLPPSAEQIAAFQADLKTNPDAAYERAADSLLASTAYGENMAIGWLDAARYADSYGYQSDKLNTQWPYRDWVIRSFNDNLPYDQFVTQQIAGDLLDNPTTDQKLATAFNRIHRLNNEGGAIFDEWKFENIADRVHTYGTAMLGLTMECARCHDHKYDPITAKDYFSIFAFFNSIDENGMYDRTVRVPSPSMILPTAPETQAIEEAREAHAIARQAYEQALANPALTLSGPVPTPKPRIALDLDGSLHEQAFFSKDDSYKAKDMPFTTVDGAQGLALDGDHGFSVNDIKPFDYWDHLTLQTRIKLPAPANLRATIAHTSQGTDAGFNGWDLVLENGHLEARLYRVWPGSGSGVRTVAPIPSGKFINLTHTYDGSGSAAGLKLYVDGVEQKVEILRDNILKSASVATQHGGKFVFGYRWRDRGIAGAFVDSLALYDRALTAHEIQLISGVEPTASPREALAANTTEAVAARTASIAAHKAIFDALEPVSEVPIMEELAEPIPAYVHDRGEYNLPKVDDGPVERTTFEHILPDFGDEYSKDRLGLAKWTVHPDHPLTSRVFVNRVWQRFFGAGLVDTPENYGLQGSLPSHPQLLDYLCRDFVDNGWDIKRLCRQIVLSATYRQNSSASPELLEKDPVNILLARGPAYRLGAEQIRDLALAASGLMNDQKYGPPVSPYQPGKDLWRESNGMSPAYKQDVGKALYRRSIYSVWKRTAPLPNMMAFDATTREVCSVARTRTNTPLQALVLLNDIQFVEAARALAENSLVAGETPTDWVQHAFIALAGRTPDSTESEVLTNLVDEQLTHYRANQDEAVALIAHGDSPANADLPAPELAAMTTVCQAILNLDATIWKR